MRRERFLQILLRLRLWEAAAQFEAVRMPPRDYWHVWNNLDAILHLARYSESINNYDVADYISVVHMPPTFYAMGARRVDRILDDLVKIQQMEDVSYNLELYSAALATVKPGKNALLRLMLTTTMECMCNAYLQGATLMPEASSCIAFTTPYSDPRDGTLRIIRDNVSWHSVEAGLERSFS